MKMQQFIMILSCWCSINIVYAQEDIPDSMNEISAQEEVHSDSKEVEPSSINLNREKASISSNDEKSKNGDSQTEDQNTSSAENGVDLSQSDYQRLVQANKSGQSVEIEKAAKDLLAKKPNDLKTLNYLAGHYIEKKKYGLAKLVLLKAFSKHPESASLNNNYGLMLFGEKSERDAMVYLKKSLDQDQNLISASANLGSIYAKYRDFGRASQYLQTAHKGYPDDFLLANNFAVSLRGDGKYEESEELYKNLLHKSASKNKNEIMLNYAILLIDFMDKKPEGLKLIRKINFVDSSESMRRRLNELEKRASSKKTDDHVDEKPKNEPIKELPKESTKEAVKDEPKESAETTEPQQELPKDEPKELPKDEPKDGAIDD